MTYASLIKEKKFGHGGRLLVARVPGSKHVWVDGSIAGGTRLAGSRVLTEVHAAMLLDGTAHKTKRDIQILLDKLGASLSFSATTDRLAWHAHCRTDDLGILLALIAEVLREPAFPAKELVVFKKRAEAELSLEAQNTRTQAQIALSRLIYPDGHPNRDEPTVDALAALGTLTRADLKAYHARAIDAATMVLAIAGDITLAAAKDVADKKLSRLPHDTVTLPVFTAARPCAAQHAQTIIKEKASIDYMLGAATGITKDHPDYPALVLGLQILGDRNGFSGRLMQTVRERDGLTYAIYATPNGFGAADGAAVIWATFAPQLFEKGKVAIMREVQLLLESGPSATETKLHAHMYAARIQTSLASAAALARTTHALAAEGRAMSYLDDLPSRILTLTPAQVTTSLRKYLALEHLSSSAAGMFS
ncbi:insulinase family protein [Candidatus Kaiserbacteria bacterium]|nr:insulinase family protein [Candidatus Kaiserbacteria bacterium]